MRLPLYFSYGLILSLLLGSAPAFAQSDSRDYVYSTFRGTRIINGHSVETLHYGELEMIIGHRFGRLNDGAYNLFGLDQSSIRLGLDYGIRDWLTVGIGRSSQNKAFDGFLKLRLLRQAASGDGGSPVSITLFSSTAYTSLKAPDPDRPLQWQNRLAYTSQLLLARKLTDRLSLQLMPSLLHLNLVELATRPNDIIALGAGGKYQLSKNLALTGEYYYLLPDQVAPDRTNALSVGIDLNTGSHVFQIHLTNSAGMIEKQFLGDTTGDWTQGDIHLGFNMVRTFKLKGRRY